MTDDLVKRLLWHVEKTIGPVSDEPIVNEHDSDKAVLLSNFQAETKRVIEYWYRQGKDDGVLTERETIVAWLRGDRADDMIHSCAQAADAIEAGEHHDRG